jgi:hypothetical protein
MSLSLNSAVYMRDGCTGGVAALLRRLISGRWTWTLAWFRPEHFHCVSSARFRCLHFRMLNMCPFALRLCYFWRTSPMFSRSHSPFWWLSCPAVSPVLQVSKTVLCKVGSVALFLVGAGLFIFGFLVIGTVDDLIKTGVKNSLKLEPVCLAWLLLLLRKHRVVKLWCYAFSG